MGPTCFSGCIMHGQPLCATPPQVAYLVADCGSSLEFLGRHHRRGRGLLGLLLPQLSGTHRGLKRAELRARRVAWEHQREMSQPVQEYP